MAAAILHGDKPQVQAFEYPEAKPPKKRRSDAGVPRKPRARSRASRRRAC